MKPPAPFRYMLPIIMLMATGCNMHNIDKDKKRTDSTSTGTTVTSPLSPTEMVTGDFNGDGKKEQAWVMLPAFNKDSSGCTGDCSCSIRFSDKRLPSIEISGAISAELSNTGDLNKNGTDELGVWPGAFAGCWNNYHVYSFAGNQWEEAVKPFPVHCNQMEDGLAPVQADTTQKKIVIIHYSVNTDEGIVTKTKKVRIR